MLLFYIKKIGAKQLCSFFMRFKKKKNGSLKIKLREISEELKNE